MKVRGTVEGAELESSFAQSERQVPYAAAIFLTKIAVDGRSRVQRRMGEVFDNPTDWTQRGVFTKGATRDELVAEVYFPQSQEQRGRADREYIRPETQGAAARQQKKTEYLLTRIGVLPPGWVTTPGKGAKLDSHGNLAGSVYKQIINVLQLRYTNPKPVSARSQKGAKRLGVESLFFAVAPGPNKLAKGGGWLPPGVWKHLPGHRITQILKFVQKAGYKQRLNLEQEIKQVLGSQGARRWEEASEIIRERFNRSR